MAMNIVPYTSSAKARLRARERREWLIDELRTTEGEAPRRGIQEIPPGFEVLDKESEYEEPYEEPTERYGQLARLRWQLGSDAFLLLERVTDLVLRILENEKYTVTNSPFAIKLSAVKFHRLRGLFPWRVIVCSHDQDMILDSLRPHADWLGIGVDLDEPPTIRSLGRCLVGYDALTGLVGGTLAFYETYGVTCRHVLSSECNSVASPTCHTEWPPSRFVSEAPDATLLRVNTPCFQVPIDESRSVTEASVSLIEQWMLTRSPILQVHPESKGQRLGIVKAQVSASRIGSTIYRFPQSEVILNMRQFFFGMITIPFGRTCFSYPGDSGSWVCGNQLGPWLGITTAGDDMGATYVTDASCLMEYFKLLLGESRVLATATWSAKKVR